MALEDQVGNWFDKLVDQGQKQVASIPGPYAKPAGEALAAFVTMKPDVVELGKDAVTQVTSLLAIGKTDDAKKLYLDTLRESAGLDELFQASKDSSNSLVASGQSEAAMEARWIAFAEKLGQIALNLLPLLVAFG